MLLTETVTININSRNIKNLKKLGYKDLKIKNKLIIPVEHLTPNSVHIIDAKCDVCGEIKTLPYQYYNNSIKNGGYFCCSRKCSNNKRSSTLYENYSVNYPTQSNEIKEKIKNVNIEKYGVEHNSQRCDIKNKKIKTLLKNYGVKNPSQSEEIKLKKEQTSLLNFGVKYHTQNIIKYNNTFKLYLIQYKNFDLHYQSTYELNFLKYLEINNKIYDLTDYKKGIKYIFNNKEQIYYPDFFIEKFNLIIEIKSTYWYNKFLEKNISKKYYCEKLGYNYILIIDNNFDEFINKYYPSKL